MPHLDALLEWSILHFDEILSDRKRNNAVKQ